MAKSYPEYGYDLADELIDALKPYRAEGIVASVADPGWKSFREAGRRAGSAAVEAGKKHRDRTGDLIEEVAAKTGVTFPSLMQRYLEIWILCTGLAEKFRLKQATHKGILCEVGHCAVGERVTLEWPGIEASACAGYCTGALETISEQLGMKLEIKREALEVGQGLCKFTITPGK